MTNTNDNQTIRLINPIGDVEDGYVIDTSIVDKRGLVCICHPGIGQTYRVNPKRIIKETTLADIQPTLPVKPVKLIKHGKPAGTRIVVASLARVGELWVKKGIEFDDGKTDVRSYYLILISNDRYLTFNTYDGIYSNHGKILPIDDILSGGSAGHRFHDLVKLRRRLSAAGYAKY